MSYHVALYFVGIYCVLPTTCINEVQFSKNIATNGMKFESVLYVNEKNHVHCQLRNTHTVIYLQLKATGLVPVPHHNPWKPGIIFWFTHSVIFCVMDGTICTTKTLLKITDVNEYKHIMHYIYSESAFLKWTYYCFNFSDMYYWRSALPCMGRKIVKVKLKLLWILVR